MPDEYRITLARRKDLPLLAYIERSAASLLAGHAPASVLEETSSEEELESARQLGRLWVALAGDTPVGFARVDVRESGAAHLEEIDVLPAHGRRGLGTRLVTTVCSWAASQGFHAVTLTTFRDVPWNMPFYAGLGFEVIPRHQLTPALLSVVTAETRRGLDPFRRVAMRRRCEVR